MQSFLKSAIPISFLMALIFFACTKHRDPIIAQPYTGPVSPLIASKEYFWRYTWQKDFANGYEIMNVDSWRLTDSAINKGIKIYVAIETEWSRFERISQTLYDPFLP